MQNIEDSKVSNQTYLTLGIFHATQASICLNPHQNYGEGWRR